jgi:hypothetical protein
MKKTKLLYTILFSAFIFFSCFSSFSQTVYLEGFEPAVDSNTILEIPFGWSQVGGFHPNNRFDRSSNGLLPLANPHSGNAFLHYDSFWIPSGFASYIVTRPLDMSNIPATGAAVNFWLYRDGFTYQTNTDRIQVYLDTIPSILNATLLTETVTGATTLHRSCNLTPAPDTCNNWNQYFYTVPPAFNSSTTYLMIVATSGFGNDIYIDDVSIDTYPDSQAYITNSAAVVGQVSAATTQGAVNQLVPFCRITVSGTIDPLEIDSMLFNTNGSTDPVTDITNAKLWFSGGTNHFNPYYDELLGTYLNPGATNFYMLTAANANYSGLSTFTGLHNGENYFWLTYDISPTAIMCDEVDAEWISFTSGDTTYIPSPVSIPGTRQIGNCTGIESAEEMSELFSAYAADDILNISFNSILLNNCNYAIVDCLGKNVAAGNLSLVKGTNHFQIPFKFSHGVYHFTLMQNDKKTTRKFIY